MKLAIMQPYLFPYIGYIQLLAEVDTFILYDDVAYINRGWVNRNKLLVNGQEYLFTIPLVGASQNKLINEIDIEHPDRWRGKLIRTIEQSYKKAPHYESVMALIEDSLPTQPMLLSVFIAHSLQKIASFLDIKTTIIESSIIYNNQHLKAQERILDICKQTGASHYINPIGGTELYSKEIFAQHDIQLNFIQSKKTAYPQLKNEFVPWLSVIDVLMFNDQPQTTALLNQFELV
jgi:hypothetical protein